MEIAEQIIDIDGSCRDVNFPDVSQSQAYAVVSHFQSICALKTATDSEGNDLNAQQMEERLSLSSSETIVSHWISKGLISQVQLFLSWESNSKIFIEITFFPNDVERDHFNLHLFFEWLAPILDALETNEYYVRYENASWKYGDISQHSGVIISNDA